MNKGKQNKQVTIMDRPLVNFDQYKVRRSYRIEYICVGLIYALLACLPFINSLNTLTYVLCILSIIVANACLIYDASDYNTVLTLEQLYNYRIKFIGGLTLTLVDLSNVQDTDYSSLVRKYNLLIRNYQLLDEKYNELSREVKENEK